MILMMVSFILITPLLFTGFMCKSNINLYNPNGSSQIEKVAEHFSDLIYDIGKRFLYNKQAIYFVIPQTRDQIFLIMDMTIKKTIKSWLVFTNDSYCCDSVAEQRLSYDKKIQIYQVPDVYIVPYNHHKTFEYFEAQLTMLQRPDDFNPRAVFFIIRFTEYCDEVTQDKILRERLFNLMWRNNLFATTLFFLSECEMPIKVATAKPFTLENPCRTVEGGGVRYFHISTATETNISVLYEEPNHLQKCDILIGTIPLPPYVVGKQITIENEILYEYVGGIEIELVRLLSELMNFTFKFHKTHSYGLDAWFSVLPNGTVIGILQDLLLHNIDMAFGGFIPDYVTYYKYDYSTSYKFSSISCYVTDPNFIPQWLIFFVAFSFEVWILSVVVFVIVSLLYYFMEKYGFINRKLQANNFKGIHFADFFSINLGMGSMLDPKSAHLRILFFAWAVYCVHWYSAYTSILFTYITSPPLEKEIKTIEDLKESGLKVGLDITYKEIFAHNEIDKVAKSVLDNHLVCTHLETCVKKFVKDRNFSVMDKAEGIEYLVNLKQSKVHKLSQNMMTYFVSTITTRGNPVSKEFSQVAMRAFEAGLLDKWEKDVGLQYHNVKNVEIPSEEESMPLSVEDLIGSFMILLFGLFISFIICMVEIVLDLFEKDKVKPI